MKMTKTLTPEQLETAIREEKRQILQDLLGEAWDLGVEAGIEPALIAEGFVLASFEELYAVEGAQSANALAEQFSTAIEQGLFPVPRDLQ